MKGDCFWGFFPLVQLKRGYFLFFLVNSTKDAYYEAASGGKCKALCRRNRKDGKMLFSTNAITMSPLSTVWKFEKNSASQILCEINGISKIVSFTVLQSTDSIL